MTHEEAWRAVKEDLEERLRWAEHIRRMMGQQFSEPAGQGQWDAIRWMLRRMELYERWFIAHPADPPAPDSPDVCPVTGYPFFRLIRHPDGRWVPLYGHRWFCFTLPRPVGSADDDYEADFFAYYDGVWEPMGVRFRRSEGIRYAFDRYTWLKRLSAIGTHMQEGTQT
ncbi:MAG: hypothetical protein IRZ10_08820 [Thermoflavifilum sp.]|nr:hypothetical protein [Thermoflavifilum sp.]MCL6514513.1 hypothetical protein [Alicyclobacillus sp.]